MIELIMQQGRTVLFSSHILADVERVAERIVVIDKGVLRANCSLEQFQRAVRKVRLVFAGAPPVNIDIPGLLHHRRSENQLEIILVGNDDTQIRGWADKVGAQQFEFVSMNLEDQFIEFTATPGRRRLFVWEEK
jgi:ABC-2 type transport system ATP-binding protein